MLTHTAAQVQRGHSKCHKLYKTVVYRIVGIFRGRKLSRICAKMGFHGEIKLLLIAHSYRLQSKVVLLQPSTIAEKTFDNI